MYSPAPAVWYESGAGLVAAAGVSNWRCVCVLVAIVVLWEIRRRKQIYGDNKYGFVKIEVSGKKGGFCLFLGAKSCRNRREFCLTFPQNHSTRIQLRSIN